MRVKDDQKEVVQAQDLKNVQALKSKPIDQGGAPKDMFADEANAKPDDGGGKLKRTEERKTKKIAVEAAN